MTCSFCRKLGHRQEDCRKRINSNQPCVDSNGNFDASQLLKQLDNVQKPFSADHWQFSSPAVMLGLALLLAVVAAVIWKKCCAQTSHTATVHIPPAQPVLQQPMAQPQLQIPRQDPPQPQVQQIPQQAPPAYQQQNPTFNFSKPTAPVLIYT
jgi:hypothetical protein